MSTKDTDGQWLIDNQGVVIERCRARWPAAKSVGWEWEDWYQEGMCWALEALHRYDPARGASMATWVYKSVDGRLQAAIAYTALKRNGASRRHERDGAPVWSIDAPLGDDADAATWHEIIAAPDDRIHERIDARRRLSELSAKHLLRAARIAAGLAQTDIARAMGVTRVTIGNWETGAKRISPARLEQALAVIAEHVERSR